MERVLRLVAQSRSNSEIAMELAVGIEVVAELKQRAMTKVRLVTRLDAIHYAEERGWATRRT